MRPGRGRRAGARAAPPPLRAISVFCRVTGQVNAKPRPSWFSKRDCLGSMLDALEVVRTRGVAVRVVLVVDGVIDLDRLRPHGTIRPEVLALRGGSSRRSMLNLYDCAVRLAGPDDLVWFGEDDYVYAPEAFVHLLGALERTGVDYAALHYPQDFAWHATHPSQPLSKAPFPMRTVDVGTDPPWMTVTHSTSTFGARAAAVRRDRWLLGLVTRAGSPFAHATAMAVQGRAPYRWRRITADANWSRRPAQWRFSALRAPMRVAVNLGALYQGRRHTVTMLAPCRDLVCHVEEGFLTDHRDWRALATDPGPGAREESG